MPGLVPGIFFSSSASSFPGQSPLVIPDLRQVAHSGMTTVIAGTLSRSKPMF
jgi:hypothetical protein